MVSHHWPAVVPLVVAAMLVPAAAVQVADSRWLAGTRVIAAQTTTAPSADRIRAQAQRMKEYKSLLADPDSNVRLATLDEMLKSGEPAISELAYEAGFASADQTMRALTLRARIFSMKGFILELQNVTKLPEEEWQKVLAYFGGVNRSFNVTKVDAQTGTIDLSAGCSSGRVAGQEFSFTCGSTSVRLRLGDGARMTGTMSYQARQVAVILTLQ
jgi:hypothetical protein